MGGGENVEIFNKKISCYHGSLICRTGEGTVEIHSFVLIDCQIALMNQI